MLLRVVALYVAGSLRSRGARFLAFYPSGETFLCWLFVGSLIFSVFSYGSGAFLQGGYWLYDGVGWGSGGVFDGSACVDHERRLGGLIGDNIVVLFKGGGSPYGFPGGKCCPFHRSSAFLCCFNLRQSNLINMVSVSGSVRALVNSSVSLMSVM